jgi:uncharacterized membrane protein
VPVMIALAALVQLPATVVGLVGLAIILGQSLLVPIAAAMPQSTHWLWQFLYLGGQVKIGAVTINILYVLVPWIGVMAAGYGFGTIMTREARLRSRLCLGIGLGATVLFLAIGGWLVTNHQAPASAPPLLIRLLAQRKYPASILFLLMTLGPTIAFLPLAERARGRVASIVTTYGRVPMFYYLLHIPLIHATALLVWFLRDGSAGATRFHTAPDVFIPPAYRWSLGLLYLVFAIVVAALYPLCRWYAERKATKPAGWMRYI